MGYARKKYIDSQIHISENYQKCYQNLEKHGNTSLESVVKSTDLILWNFFCAALHPYKPKQSEEAKSR